MKNLIYLLVVMLFASTAFAGVNNVKNDNIEQSLLVGLQSDNLGLKTSSAYLLGELGSSKSVIDLMKVLRNGETEEERISAALALSKINTATARFAVKQRIKFDDSERVRRMCTKFYYDI